jgi:uncharacterized sulfatase
MIELAGGTVPEYMQGESFKAILETGEEPEGWKQATYYRYWMHMAHRHANPAHFGIRTKDYKLIFFYGLFYKDTGESANFEGWGNRYGFRTPPGWEFYDLKDDPKEMDNRYSDPAYAETIALLKIRLAELRSEIGEIDDQFPEITKVIEEHWND